jgi:hypothetical protein
MKIFKVEIMVLDFDKCGEEGVKNLLENTRYPNWAIHPIVKNIESREIEWSDDHPLNKKDTTDAEYERLFRKKLEAQDCVEPNVLEEESVKSLKSYGIRTEEGTVTVEGDDISFCEEAGSLVVTKGSDMIQIYSKGYWKWAHRLSLK